MQIRKREKLNWDELEKWKIDMTANDEGSVTRV